jgi:aminoglycoside phosphotransferase (APT) family kinase protein
VTDAALEWVAGLGYRVVDARRLSGGFRNDNRVLTTDRGRRLVLRRCREPAAGAVEVAVAGRVRGVVPVPEVVAADPGRGFVLAEFAPGRLLSEVVAEGAADPELGRVAGAALAGIGTVRFGGPGLFGGAGLVPEPGSTDIPLGTFVRDCLSHSAAPLADTERNALIRLAERDQSIVDDHAGASALVHGDFNPKNILVRREHGRWVVSAVLDWEFAFSGHPLSDVGNMLRFPDELPGEFADGFVAGLRAGGAELPPDWPELARALDLFALADLLTRPPQHPLAAKVLAAVRQRLG